MEVKDVFEEWNAYAKKKELLDRDIDLDSIIRDAKLKIIAITGIRRAGKSSLLMLLSQKLLGYGKKVAYINVEDSRIKNRNDVLDEALKWFGEDGFLLLDEITSAGDWEGWLARNHELLKGRLMLIVSSSRKRLVMPSKPLRGRMLPFELYPLSFKEFLRFKRITYEKTTVGKGAIETAFAEYMKYGGYPEVALTDKEIDKVRIIDSYFKDIMGLDVAEMSGEDINIVEAFCRYIVQSQYFSASKCLNVLKSIGYKIGKEKILALESYSKLSYLFFFIPIFSYKIKDRAQYPRKAYSGDNGFPYSTGGRIDKGRLLENIVLLELKRRTQGRTDICYWKNAEGLETDFLIRQGTEVSEAIQVVYDLNDEKTQKREIKALVQCANEIKPHKSSMITMDVSKIKMIDGLKIRFIPAIDWLLGKY